MKRLISIFIIVLFLVSITSFVSINVSADIGPKDQGQDGCFAGGCSGQICSTDPGVITTCEWTPEYGCLQDCRLRDNECGFDPEIQTTCEQCVQECTDNEQGDECYGRCYVLENKEDNKKQEPEQKEPLFTDLFFFALALTIIIETSILYIAIRILKKPILLGTIIGTGILTSALTLPYIWFVLPNYLTIYYQTIVAEIFAISIEAGLFFTLLRLSWKHAIVISLLCNVVSYVAGLILF